MVNDAICCCCWRFFDESEKMKEKLMMLARDQIYISIIQMAVVVKQESYMFLVPLPICEIPRVQ